MLKRLIFVILLVLLGVNVSLAQDATPEPTEEIISPALAQQMAGLEQITQTLRGLTAKSPVEHRFPTRQQTIDYLKASYDREFPPEKFAELKSFYVALDLLPADIDLQSVYLGLLGSQVAGYYDPETKTMNVLEPDAASQGKPLSFTDQITYIHEFTHALQDQYFDLNALLPPELENDPDRGLAVTSLVEGDATASMTLYMQAVEAKNPFAVLGMLVQGAQAGNLTLPEGVPPILTDELLFPYTEGLNFILALNTSGGWDAINAAFKNPPTTTEQILHPDKYLAGEDAQTVVLNDMSAVLGDGWTNEWDSSVGEYYLRQMLGVQLNTSEASKAAAGWGGDHLRVYTNGDQIASTLKITWDTPAEQSEFERLYEQYGLKRFGSAVYANGCWQNSSSAVCLVSDSSGDLIVTAPTLAQATAVAAI
ncbi:MAG: hypothetical protein ABI700_11360 [Chloroflexota bacterium]